VVAYTDGGCDPNPGPGGWAAILRWQDREWQLSGNDPATTNNRMELQAAAAALSLLEGLLGRCRVEIHTDSRYLRQGISDWIKRWVGNDWQTLTGEPVKNQDLWQTLYRLVQAHDVSWHWLKGHAGHPLNERADHLAREAQNSLRLVDRVPGPAAMILPSTPPRRDGVAPAVQVPAEPGIEVDISVKVACRQPRGAGGWGAVLRSVSQEFEIQGHSSSTTANQLLIQGAAEALRALRKPSQVRVTSDAQYLIQGASIWIRAWQSNGWKTKDGKPVAHQAEWRALLEAARPHRVTWTLHQGEPSSTVPDRDRARAGELAEGGRLLAGQGSHADSA
jgi:ribonuclease HI